VDQQIMIKIHHCL